MRRDRVVYFHGGPGFNGNPERNLLVGPYAARGLDLRVWDEPSSRRPSGAPYRQEEAFRNLLECSEAFFLASYSGSPLLLMGHSFGAVPATYVAARHPEKVRHVFLVCSDLALSVTDRNIFELTRRDFEEHGDARHLELKKVLDRFSGAFDENVERGFDLVLQNPGFLSYYWRDHVRMGDFLKCYAEPEFGIDLGAFLAVRRSSFELPAGMCPVPATALFGAHDRIVTQAAELPLIRKYFSDLEVELLSSSAHYPHLEETGAVLELIERKIRSHETSAPLQH